MDAPKVAVVTGANQGLGRAVVEQLAEALGPAATVYLTGRDQDRVDTAASETPGTAPARLDVADSDSVAAFADLVRRRHGGVDIVVSNAAARISRDRADADQVREFVNTNNLGTTRMIRAFGPLLRPDARFLVVASAFGSLRRLADPLPGLFDTDTMVLDDVDRVMLDYVDLVEAGRAGAAGWPAWINVPSKIGQVAAARIFARDNRSAAYIGAVCPGLVDTDASRPWFDDMSTALSPTDAARDLVRLAVAAVQPEFRGQLVQHGRIISWT
jgi:carbonyl reductase 1